MERLESLLAWRKLDQRQSEKKQTRFVYVQGPMYYIGQKIVRKMQDAGYPAKIFCNFRSRHEQNRLFELGRTKAKAGESPHQYLCAVDIIHPENAWNVSPAYWDALGRCTAIVADELGVDLEWGGNWSFYDPAHIELKDWRAFKRRVDAMPHSIPTSYDLFTLFETVLPNVAAQYLKSRAGQNKRAEIKRACNFWSRFQHLLTKHRPLTAAQKEREKQRLDDWLEAANSR